LSEPRVLSTRDGYDLWAATYDTMGNWLLAFEEPEVDRALGPVAGLDVLDVGAGTGRHAVRLAAAGARVTAIDFSEEMLARARDKAGGRSVRWILHDANTPLPFAAQTFDRVLSALVLEHIELARLRPFFAELGRVCRADGRVVVTAMHPAMFLKGISANFRDGTGEVRPRSYEAAISDYVNGALGGGLRIERLSEHRVDERLAERFERARKFLGWPALFVMELRPNYPAENRTNIHRGGVR
jgi:SAM-dependent methyltransferase